MKRIISLLSAVLMLMALCVPAFAEDDISGEIRYGVLYVSGSGVIPANLFIERKDFHGLVIEKGITGIGTNAFDGCDNLKTVSLPEGLEYIGDSAFEWCKGLREINIPDGVKSIGKRAFMKCGAFSEVKIPSTVSYIGDEAFAYCTALTATLRCTNNTTFGILPFYQVPKLNIILPDGWNGGYDPFASSDVTYFIEPAYLDVAPNAYINTEYVPKINTRVVMDCEVNNQWTALFGTIYYGYDHYYHYYVNSDGAKFGSGFCEFQSWAEGAPVQTGRHTIELDGNVFKYDGTPQTEHGGSELLSWGTPMYLFGIHLDDWTQTFKNQKIRFYSCKIYEGDNLVRDFIPVLFGNEFGLYDLQECKFYSKQVGGSMTVPDNSTASVISEGNMWIVAAVGAVAVAVAAIVIKKKKAAVAAEENSDIFY